MATPVQRWSALLGALLDPAVPSAGLQTSVAEACCLARDLTAAQVAALNNTQKATLALQDVTEFLRTRRRAALKPARAAAMETQLTADTTAELPEVLP